MTVVSRLHRRGLVGGSRLAGWSQDSYAYPVSGPDVSVAGIGGGSVDGRGWRVTRGCGRGSLVSVPVVRRARGIRRFIIAA
jgi:hypothetical protein